MFRCENICKGPETVGNRRSMYHIAPTTPIAAKLQQMYLAGSMLPWKQPYGFIASPVWSGSFTQVTTAIHPNDRACSSGWWYRWCTLLARILPYIYQDYVSNMTTGIWQAGFYKEKRKKHFVGIQKILSLHVVVYQYNTVAEQKHCSAETKNNST